MATFQEGGEERLERICIEFALALHSAIDTKELDRAADGAGLLLAEMASTVFHEAGVQVGLETGMALLYEAGFQTLVANATTREPELRKAMVQTDRQRITMSLLGQDGWLTNLKVYLRRWFRRLWHHS